jgi:hypothetical protein
MQGRGRYTFLRTEALAALHLGEVKGHLAASPAP